MVTDEITGNCFECGKPCTDHDLVADVYWCDECIQRSWDQYLKDNPDANAPVSVVL